ncbi:MAG: hypothetical protein ACREPR_16990 [Brasilonema sp.]
MPIPSRMRHAPALAFPEGIPTEGTGVGAASVQEIPVGHPAMPSLKDVACFRH